jgi:hypothetical protein
MNHLGASIALTEAGCHRGRSTTAKFSVSLCELKALSQTQARKVAVSSPYLTVTCCSISRCTIEIISTTMQDVLFQNLTHSPSGHRSIAVTGPDHLLLTERSQRSRGSIGTRKITACSGNVTSDENQAAPSGVNIHPPSPTALPRFGRNISERDFMKDDVSNKPLSPYYFLL